MRTFILLLLLGIILDLSSQNILLLEKPGTVNNYKYYAGDYIRLKTKKGIKISGPINIIRDTNLIVDFTHELSLSDIEVVYKTRTLVALGSSALIAGSALYIGLDLINGGSKGKSFSENQGLQVSLAVLATGVGMSFFSKKRMKVQEDKWRLRILPQDD